MMFSVTFRAPHGQNGLITATVTVADPMFTMGFVRTQRKGIATARRVLSKDRSR